MTGVGVVSVHVGSLSHVVCKWESVLVVDCFDYILDFFVSIDQSNELLDFIWPCGEVDYRLDSKRIPVLPEIPPLLQHEANVISVITCETQFNCIGRELVDHQHGIFDLADHP